MKYAITTFTDKTYLTEQGWSSRQKDARVYKTMRVRDVCEAAGSGFLPSGLHQSR